MSSDPDPDRSVRVLHVDDDPDFASTAAAFLEREARQFEVTTAIGAEAGLDRLASEAVDCVVSDYDMPGRNGVEFLAAVREDHPDLPFILFTGKGSEEVASEAISAGVTDSLQKGVGTDQYAVLANRITNAVEHDQARKRADRGKRRLREIIDALPHPLYVVDSDGTYLLANEALVAFHDATVDAVEGSHVSAVLDGETSDSFMEGVSSVIESGEQERFPLAEMTHSSGETRVFEPLLLPYALAETGDRAVLGIAVDVTERVRRERRLNTLVERLEALHDATRRLVLVEDRRAVAGILTDAVRHSFEYARSVVRLREDDTLRPVAVIASVRREVDDRPSYALDEGLPGEALQSGETIVVDDRRAGTVESPRTWDDEHDGESFPHRSAMYVPIGDHGVMTVGYPDPGVFDDTDRSLARILADNAATVLDRLAGETEWRRQNDRLETLVGVVSHDLRNSLDVAQSRVDRARSDPGGDDADAHLDAVVGAHDRMEAIIEDMQSLARAGSPAVGKTSLDLERIVTECWDALAPVDAALAVDVDVTIRADEDRLRMLLENRFRNAVDHGSRSATPAEDAADDAVEDATADVSIRVGPLEDGFFVEDDGPGIPEDDRDSVFETGYSTTGEGTGFGLPIVTAIAHAHGWDVEVTTGTDGGARFEFTGVESG